MGLIDSKAQRDVIDAANARSLLLEGKLEEEYLLLLGLVRRLECQRDYLAKLLGDLCTTQKDGECPLFYACPASGFGWSCGNAIKEDWIYTAEQTVKEAETDAANVE